MGVAKMKYLNVYGPEKKLKQALGVIAECRCFAPESDEALHSPISTDNNSYEPLLTKAKGLLKDLGENSLAEDFSGTVDDYDLAEVSETLEKYASAVAEVNRRKTEIESQLELQEKTEGILSHMSDLDISVEDLFQVKTLKVRVGRLPKSSYARLSYYSEKGFNFTSYFNFIVYDFDGEFYWGLYFAPTDNSKDVDDIFNSLFFERIWVPDFVQGKPGEALKEIHEKIDTLKLEYNSLTSSNAIVDKDQREQIKNMAAWLNSMAQLYEMKKHVMVFNHMFYISGFVPADDLEEFESRLKAVNAVKIKEAETKQEVLAPPPVKLKNRWFAKPYQMFTEMYGLPAYTEMDPTALVAVIYSVLYGLMFADVGQGLVLGLVGYFFMYKKKNMAIGLILTRVSIFSVFFGFLFGSIFGYEHLLDPMWKAIGIPGLPFNVFGAASINIILLVSVGIGVCVVAMTIILSILTKFKKGRRGEALTGPNGLAGLVFYLGIVLLLMDSMVLHTGIFSGTVYLVIVIVLPLAVMYMQEPLNSLINKEGLHIENPADLFVSGFFEMFVSILEYMSNTVSFLRVGGFVLAHAGMMSVVVTLAEMAGSAAPVVMLFGNIFVICLEGLIVGIQALRLNFYEVFSRFYDADGIPFEPLKIEKDTHEL